MKIRIGVQKINDQNTVNVVRSFALDRPAVDSIHSSDDILHVSGWVLRANAAVKILVRHGSTVTEHFPFMPRTDVITKVVKDDLPLEHPELKCGFSFGVPANVRFFEIGFSNGTDECWPYKIWLIQETFVIEGEDGWLFLGADSNRSVDQFIGIKPLAKSVAEGWRKHFNTVSTLSEKYNFKWQMSIAPAKEMAFADKYPYPKANTSTIDEFIKLFHDIPISYPIEKLVENRDLTYWRCDTHWTAIGAKVASDDIIDDFGMGTISMQPQFRYLEWDGDLGMKLVPRRVSGLMRNADPSLLVYETAIKNTGRVRIYENAKNDPSLRCIVFGDSFSGELAPYLAQHFNRVVSAHTVAAVDEEIIEHEKPSHVIIQTNSRFIVESPTPNSQNPLRIMIRGKMGKETFSLDDKSLDYPFYGEMMRQEIERHNASLEVLA